jgi:hypothetical protein
MSAAQGGTQPGEDVEEIMNRIFNITLMLVCLCAAVTVAQAQGPCSLQTFTGTYAFYERGSSAIFDPTSQPYPFHWAGAFAPFVTVGEVTMGSEGIGDGFYWIREGSLNGGLDPIPVHVTVTEMNKDCTGKFSYLAGNTTIVERIIVFDNGREFRTIPASISQNGDTTLAWVGEGHRISKPGEPLNTCGPQTAKGAWLWAVENLVRFDTPVPILSDAVLLRFDISMTGDYTGTLYEKLGPHGDIVLPVRGTMTVNPDCSFATGLIIDFGGGVTATAPVRGVFFDEGKKAFGLNMNTDTTGTQYSVGTGVRIGP